MRSLLAERIQLHLRNFPDAMSVLRIRRRMSSRCGAADLKAKTEAVAVLLQPLRSRCVVGDSHSACLHFCCFGAQRAYFRMVLLLIQTGRRFVDRFL